MDAVGNFSGVYISHMLHVCLPTCTINGEMQADVPYMDHLAFFGTMKLNCILEVPAPDFVSEPCRLCGMGSRRCQCIVAFEGGFDRGEAGFSVLEIRQKDL